MIVSSDFKSTAFFQTATYQRYRTTLMCAYRHGREDDPGIPGNRSGDGNIGGGLQILQLGEDGSHISRQSWMETSDLRSTGNNKALSKSSH